jgi:hypothetical protein
LTSAAPNQPLQQPPGRQYGFAWFDVNMAAQCC